ncbi:hypothetical protein BHE74_00050427 [Ensete ventricosum]|nr:hypothetical protein GW17_00039325 [Ensete ventricosum]RWW43861.1 hypothetical protein BHE74_00050427 [Ensete ventricosum]RZS22419.1 hypothetical protein BHM03_00055186 [Ensete ventricosum]
MERDLSNTHERAADDDNGFGFRAVPEWVINLVRAEGGTDLRFIATKTITISELVSHQNCFHLPKDSVNANLIPMLSEFERGAASLLEDGGMRSTPNDEVAQMGKSVVGTEHGGLLVTLFPKCRFRCYLVLTRCDYNGGPVIKGEEMKIFFLWSALKAGDEIEIWGFRREACPISYESDWRTRAAR